MRASVHSLDKNEFFPLIERGDSAMHGLIGAADRARTDRERARQLRLAVARVAELRAALPLLVQTEAVVLSRRLAWDPPLNMALSPEDVRRAP